MLIRIERGSAVPVSRQITQQLRAQCLSGALKPGDCLPSVRQLAAQLAVNVNTIVRVYESLAADRLIELRHGDGTYVLPPSQAVDASAQLSEQREHVAGEFQAVVRHAVLLGLSGPELRRMLTDALAAARTEAPAGTQPPGNRSVKSAAT